MRLELTEGLEKLNSIKDQVGNIGLEDDFYRFMEFIKSLDLSSKFDLEEIMRQYPARKFRFVYEQEKLSVELLKLEYEAKKLYYQIYQEYRELKGNMKLTEEMIKGLINNDKKYAEVMGRIFKVREKLALLNAIRVALDDVGRMIYGIVQLNSSFYGSSKE
ncbi:MAG: hypothetical protein ABIM54_06485 [candidate division WOR-3 bacterium]